MKVAFAIALQGIEIVWKCERRRLRSRFRGRVNRS